MTYKTHIAFATTFVLYPIHELWHHTIITHEQIPQLLGIVALGAIAPDIDHTRSYISNKVPVLPYLFAFYTKHRGFTHSAIGLTVVALLLYLFHLFLHIDAIKLIAFWVGYLLHIVGDSLSVSGIRDFCCNVSLHLFPKLLRFKTGSFKELVYFQIFSIAATYEYLFFFHSKYLPNFTHLLDKALRFVN